MHAPLSDIDLEHEALRLKAIKRYDILDTPPDGAFDRITAIVARRLNVPISIISIVDEDRIWFKSHHGLDIPQIPREPGLCASAILDDVPYVLMDAKYDARSLANPLVAGEFGLRFYAGVPLRTSDGFNLGTLCALDKVPRAIDAAMIEDLQDLASLVVDQLELRLSARLEAAKSRKLAREMNHRVMNSLQFISSMLSLQSRRPLSDPARHLESAADRVLAVARVHRHFHSGEGETIDCLDYLQRLCDDLRGAFQCRIAVSADAVQIPTHWVQPLGLLVNELVANAARYAAGTVQVSYRVQEGMNTLTVSDEGPGLPDDFNLNQSRGLGMSVVQTLARQLGGQLMVDRGGNGRGARFAVAFGG